MAQIFKVAIFDTPEAAATFRAENPASLRAPSEQPLPVSGKYVVKVLGGPAVWKQRIGFLREGNLVTGEE